MADGWRIRITGAEQAEKRIRQFELLLSDLRPFWPIVTRLFVGWMSRQFDTQGGFAGRPWAALSPDYAIFKSQHAAGRGILNFTGAMRRAATSPKRIVTPRSLTLEIDDPKIEYHQEGTSRMPARPVVFGSPLPVRAQAELDMAAEHYVSDFLRRL